MKQTGVSGSGNNSGGGGSGNKDGGLPQYDAPVPVDGVIINTTGCGNGVVDLDKGEGCDDGNKMAGDGCSAICQIPAGWTCSGAPSVCMLIAVCGDGKLASNEACDDGNKTGGDGCSADCNKVDDGYECRVPGRHCVPACGDSKILAPKEGCDDGNNMDGDGCSSTCIIEPGASCTGTPSKCTVAKCGNGMVEAGESCDDGDCKTGSLKCNGLFLGDGTGCSKTCTKEPKCRDGTTTRACDTSCGNGNKEAGEDCDDGNMANGDGCSSACKKEGGYTCEDKLVPDTSPCESGSGDCLKLPIVFRDFKSEKETGGHPDFFYLGAPLATAPSIPAPVNTLVTGTFAFNKRYCVSNTSGPAKGGDSTARCWDIAQSTLDAKGKPAFNMNRTDGTNCFCQFTDWSHKENEGHVPGYGDAGMPGHILNGVPYQANPAASMTGAPWYKGLAPIVKDATSFGQWFTDSTFTGGTHVVSTLEMASIGGGQYQFASAAHSVSGGFFPLDPPGQFPITGSAAGPGTVRMVGTEALLCNLWPYWYSSAAFGAGNMCRGDQYLFPPSIATAGWSTAQQGWFHNFWYTSEARYLFNFNGAFSAQFYGDDDLFIFINGRLVLDLGGVHQRLPGQVQVAADGSATILEGGAVSPTGTIVACPGTDPYTMTVTKTGVDCRSRTMTAAQLGNMAMGKTYEIAVFHADRHPSESNYQLTLSGFATNRTNCAPRCGDGVATGAEECDCGDGMTMSSSPDCMGIPMNKDGVYGGCTSTCKYGPYCGDGEMNGDEQCDLGSKKNTSSYGAGGCTPSCQKPHFCGDTIVDEDEGEGCDLGANNGMPEQPCSLTCQIIFG